MSTRGRKDAGRLRAWAAAFGQVVKVDLVNELAQFFAIQPSRRLTAIAYPIDVGAVMDEVMTEHGGRIPPPHAEDWM